MSLVMLAPMVPQCRWPSSAFLAFKFAHSSVTCHYIKLYIGITFFHRLCTCFYCDFIGFFVSMLVALYL